jgi:hypothetical protein
MELRKQANNNRRTQLPDQPGREKEKCHHTAPKTNKHVQIFHYQRQHNAGKACVDETQTTNLPFLHSSPFFIHITTSGNQTKRASQLGKYLALLPTLFFFFARSTVNAAFRS